MIARYTRPQMASVWSEETKLAHWLRVEVLACRSDALRVFFLQKIHSEVCR